MTSLSSGYMTMRGNLSQDGPERVLGRLSVPANNTLMLSFRPSTSRRPAVALYRYFQQLDRSVNQLRGMYSRLWSRRSRPPDFTYVDNVIVLTLVVWRESCIMTRCFQLFFTFFPESKTPQKLPSGFWNCSVDHYSSFRHHMECNLEKECEDGRDEAGHCPFSSPDCQGMIAMCGRCYSFVCNLPGFNGNRVNIKKVINDHCFSLGGTVGLPLCELDWLGIAFKTTRVNFNKLSLFWVGIFNNDISSPPMYRHQLFQDKMALYYTFDVTDSKLNDGNVKCHYSLYLNTMTYESRKCSKNYIVAKELNGTVCEFTTNKTNEQSLYLEPVSLSNSQVVLQKGSMALCRSGHVTYTVLLCGFHQFKVCSQEPMSCHFDDRLSNKSQLHPSSDHTMLIPTFTCSDDVNTISFSLVCNFIDDCQDSSDESFCKHPTCVNRFTCDNGQCLSYTKVCDQTPRCQDYSEEHGCSTYKEFPAKYPSFPSPALLIFDGIRQFDPTPMHSNESCPDSHYRCPGDFNDCLPVYTRCNGIYDCIDRMDEDNCREMMCSGFFRCRASTTCLHTDHLCDGWPHCPMHDDEIVCDTSCPAGCLCQGHTFLCFQPFSARRFPFLRFLDATGTGIILSDVNHLAYLIHLTLAQCSLTIFPELKSSNLRFLDLSENQLKQVNMTVLLALSNLQTLSLSKNPITSLHTDSSPVAQHTNLLAIDLSFTALTVFDSRVFSPFVHTQKLNLTFTVIHTITPNGFHFTPQLTELYMDSSPVAIFPMDLFKHVSRLHIVSTENYKLCCKKILTSKLHDVSCHAPKDELSSCEDLLQSWFYRAFLWLTTSLSISGNVFCFCARLIGRSITSSCGFRVFVLNLSLADLLMGIYIAILGVADEQFRGRYLQFDDTWKDSIACKVAGSLCLLSSEVSALIIWMITLDRFLVLRFPFSSWRFGRMSAAVACLITWSLGGILALLPSLPMLSHWKFYSQTSICIPLPVTKQDFKGKQYSFSVLIVFNFILFLGISCGQAFIYWSVQSNVFKTNTTKVSQDMTIARRLITVAVTDFMCWFPIGLCGMLSLASIPIPNEVNVALAVFMLPLNSAINPFMYTFNTLAEKRRRSSEAKLLQWLESHSDMAFTQQTVG